MTVGQIGMCEAHPASLNAFKVTGSFFYMQPKRHMKMEALMLPLPAEAAIENRNTFTDQLHPMYH